MIGADPIPDAPVAALVNRDIPNVCIVVGIITCYKTRINDIVGPISCDRSYSAAVSAP